MKEVDKYGMNERYKRNRNRWKMAEMINILGEDMQKLLYQLIITSYKKEIVLMSSS